MINSGIYQGFARVYDLFMDEIPYDEWFACLLCLLRDREVNGGCVVDVACGTGEITKRLSAAGYKAVGIDLSEDMLMAARKKCSSEVLLLHQDMQNLELPFWADAFVCLCDGINYLTDEEQLASCFASVYQHLKPGGAWIFDMKTVSFYRDVLGGQVFADNRERASYIWENEYNEETGLNTYYLTIYELAEESRNFGRMGLFRRSEEIHYQRAYPEDTVRRLLLEAGFQAVECLGRLPESELSPQSERVYWAASKGRPQQGMGGGND